MTTNIVGKTASLPYSRWTYSFTTTPVVSVATVWCYMYSPGWFLDCTVRLNLEYKILLLAACEEIYKINI